MAPAWSQRFVGLLQETYFIVATTIVATLPAPIFTNSFASTRPRVLQYQCRRRWCSVASRVKRIWEVGWCMGLKCWTLRLSKCIIICVGATL